MCIRDRDHMFELVSGALNRMNLILHKPELVHDDINPSYNIENEINNYRNQLKSRNIEDINNKLYQYQDGVYYMDMVSAVSYTHLTNRYIFWHKNQYQNTYKHKSRNDYLFLGFH